TKDNGVKINGVMYQINTDETIKKVKTLEDAANSIHKQLKKYQDTSSEEFRTKREQIIQDLLTQLEKKDYEIGIANYIKTAKEELGKVAERYNKINTNPNTIEEKHDTIKTLRLVNSYVNSFADTINDITTLKKETPELTSLVTEADKLAGDIKRLQNEYFTIGKPILKDILQLNSTNTSITGDMWDKLLDFVDNDISFWQRHLDSLAEANDSILKIADVMTKEALQRARFRLIEDGKKLLASQKELEKEWKSGVSFLYERYSNGELTGNIVSEFNYGEWYRNKENFFAKLGKRPTNINEAKQWDIKVRIWFDENTQAHPNRENLINNKREQLINQYGQNKGTELFNKWYSENTVSYLTYEVSGEESIETKFIKELVSPSDKYRSSQFETIKNNPALYKFYKDYTDLKEKVDSLLPTKQKLGNLMPQVRKDFFDRLFIENSDGTKTYTNSLLKDVKKSFSELVIENENDTQFGITDEKGNLVNFIPVFYNKKLPKEDMNQLSLAGVDSLISFMSSAYKFTELSKLVDTMEFTKDIIGERQVKTGKLDFTVLLSNSSKETLFGKKPYKEITIEGINSKAYDRFQDYLNMIYYGQQSKKEELEVFGTTINLSKAADTFNRYTSLSSLALNVYSGLSNITVGKAQQLVEAVAGEAINKKDLLYAEKEFTNQIPNAIANMGQRLSESKIHLWNEYFDVNQDYNNILRNVNAAQSKLVQRLFKESSLYFINHAGEFYLQSTTSIALANRIKVKTKEGDIKNLWEVAEVQNGKLVFPNGITKVKGDKSTDLFKESEEGEEFTQKDIIRVINRQNWLNKRLNGIYNEVDKSAIQQYALGRLAIMFRKFIKPGWNRRWEKLTYNEEGEIWTEGYYNTTARFVGLLGKDIKSLQFNLIKNWNKLSEIEKKNVFRTLTEVGLLIGMAIVANAMTNLAEDDDEDYIFNLAAYEANRFITEMTFFWSVPEALRVLKSPAAAVNQTEKIFRLLNFTQWTDEYERGKYKGLTKFEVSTMELVPLVGTYYNFITPEEQLRFYAK
ncbi:MAG: hypothetical protein ACK58U_15970, partial [Rubrivivax sp.]